jgi:hypothetical protein
MGTTLIIIVILAIGVLAYFGLRKRSSKSGKVAMPTPSPKKDDDNKTKKDIEV